MMNRRHILIGLILGLVCIALYVASYNRPSQKGSAVNVTEDANRSVVETLPSQESKRDQGTNENMLTHSDFSSLTVAEREQVMQSYRNLSLTELLEYTIGPSGASIDPMLQSVLAGVIEARIDTIDTEEALRIIDDWLSKTVSSGDRQYLVALLGRIPDADAIKRLADELAKTTDPGFTYKITAALLDSCERLGSSSQPMRTRAMAVLDEMLKSSSSSTDLSSTVVACVARLGSEQSVDYLVSLIHDENQGIQRQAAAALETVNNPEAIAGIRRALQDNVDPEVQGPLLNALASIGSTDASNVFLSWLKTSSTDQSAFTKQWVPRIRHEGALRRVYEELSTPFILENNRDALDSAYRKWLSDHGFQE